MNRRSDEIHDAAGAYALDALDDLERARFEAHLARCASCRRDVDDFRATAALLGSAAADEPPAAMRQGVLDAIRAVRQESPFVPPVARARRRSVLTAIAAVAAAIVIGVLAVTTIDATRDRDDAQQLAHTIAAPDARTVELTGDVGRGRLVWSAEKDRAVLVLDDLPAVASGRAYELWYIRDGTPEPAGVFRPDDGRVVKVVDALPAGTSAVGVTEEPASGSTSPTGPIMLSGHAPGT